MRKLLMVVVALLGLSASARAIVVQATPVRELAPNSTQCSSVTITTTAADITGNTAISSTTLAVTKLELYAITSTNTFCSHNTSVAASGSTIGVPVPGLAANGVFPTAYAPTKFTINPTQTFSCIAAVNGGAIIVCKTR